MRRPGSDSRPCPRRARVARVRGERRVRDGAALDGRVRVEPARERVGVLAVRPAAQRERLEALDELERVERREAAAHVAERLDARE